MTEQDIDEMLKWVFTPPGVAPPLEELRRYGHHNWLSRAIRLQTEVTRTLVKALATRADMKEIDLTNLETILSAAVKLEADIRLHQSRGGAK